MLYAVLDLQDEYLYVEYAVSVVLEGGVVEDVNYCPETRGHENTEILIPSESAVWKGDFSTLIAVA